MVDTYALACEDLEPSENWTLEEDDPLVYLTEDREGYNLKRQWPNKPFPRMPEPARATDPVPEPAPSFDLQKPLAMHHLIVDYCLSWGRTPVGSTKQRRSVTLWRLWKGMIRSAPSAN